MRTQVISEKISFRKKIAAIEEAIGDTINVERLAQEDVDNALIMNKAPPDSAQKAQKMASLVTIIEKPKLPVGLGSLTGHTSQFKRLKEIS